MQDGFETTPYYKGSRAKRTGKGKGMGVCQVTGNPHEFLWVRRYDTIQYGLSFSWSRRKVYSNTVAQVCVDCEGYRRRTPVVADSVAKVKKSITSYTGEDYSLLPVLEFNLDHRVR